MQELIAKLESCLEEAKKLTTKDRKKLRESTFCGPGRSFPVPDCKHVGTAKAYLGRSKFSQSVKQKIAACINRKAKQLGCTPGKPAKGEVEQEYLDFMNDPAFEATKELINFFAEELEEE